MVRNLGLLQIERAQSPLRLTLIIGLHKGSKPLFLGHHWMGLMCSNPNENILVAAVIRHNSFWQWRMEISWPSLKLPTIARMDLVIDVVTVVLSIGHRTLFLWFSLRSKDIDVKPVTPPTEPILTNRRYNLEHDCPGVTTEPELYPHTWW